MDEFISFLNENIIPYRLNKKTKEVHIPGSTVRFKTKKCFFHQDDLLRFTRIISSYHKKVYIYVYNSSDGELEKCKKIFFKEFEHADNIYFVNKISDIKIEDFKYVIPRCDTIRSLITKPNPKYYNLTLYTTQEVYDKATSGENDKKQIKKYNIVIDNDIYKFKYICYMTNMKGYEFSIYVKN